MINVLSYSRQAVHQVGVKNVMQQNRVAVLTARMDTLVSESNVVVP